MTQCTASSTLDLEISLLHKEDAEQWDNSIIEIFKLLVRVEEFLPSPLNLEFRDPNQLEDGDVLVIHTRWMWKTYGIVSSAKEKKVICFVTPDGHPVSDMRALFYTVDIHLQEVSLDEVLAMDHGDVEVVLQQNKAETLQNAWTALASQYSWRFRSFNSEHFVTLAMTGEKQSPQSKHLQSVLRKSFYSGLESCMHVPHCVKVFSRAIPAIATLSKHEATKGIISKIFSGYQISVILDVAKQTGGAIAVSATVVSRLISGAKAGLIGGAIVEGAYLAYNGIFYGYKWWYGEISWNEFRQRMMKRIVAGSGSLAGGTVGAAIGNVICPGVGTIIGNMAGGFVGDALGSKWGEEFDEYAFDQDED